MPLTAGKSAGRKKIPQVQLNSDFWTSCPKVQNWKLNMELKTNHRTFGQKDRKSWNGVLNVFGTGQKTRHPAQPIAKLNVPDARRVLPKDFPALIVPQRAGNLHIKALSLSKNQILWKKEVIKMSFFTTAVTGLKTVVTAIGAGVAVWGVINLLEGYGNDNPGANAHVR